VGALTRRGLVMLLKKKKRGFVRLPPESQECKSFWGAEIIKPSQRRGEQSSGENSLEPKKSFHLVGREQ